MRTTRPKVFISYSWAQNKERVLDLADRLLSDGVEVVIDEYDFKEGNDKFAFMERCVVDPAIEKVLVICDRSYTEKSDKREGGVGDEITVMSPKIYGKAKQEKYIPIVFEKDEVGKPYLPALLASRKYIDMSDASVFEDGYSALLHNLYDEPVRRKPALGKAPEWLVNPLSINTAKIETTIQRFQQASVSSLQSGVSFQRSIPEFTRMLVMLEGDEAKGLDEVALIDRTKPIRDTFLRFLDAYLACGQIDGVVIAAGVEQLYCSLPNRQIGLQNRRGEVMECYQFFFWELVICITALLLRYRLFSALYDFLTYRYCLHEMRFPENGVESRDVTYFRQYFRGVEELHKVKQPDSRKITYTGELLYQRKPTVGLKDLDLIDADVFISQFVFAFYEGEVSDWSVLFSSNWFPVSYVYRGHGKQSVWSRLVSRRYCQDLMALFGVKTVEELKAMLQHADEVRNGLSGWRHRSAFDAPPSISYSINFDEIGSYP